MSLSYSTETVLDFSEQTLERTALSTDQTFRSIEAKARVDDAGVDVDRLPLKLFGLSLVNMTQSRALDALFADFDKPKRVAFVNAHCVNVMKRNAQYLSALKQATLLLPDGSGIGLAARMSGQHLAANLNGTDLFPPLCARAAREGKSIYLLGARPGVAKAAADEMVSRYPNLQIAGAQDGYFSTDTQEAVVDAINNSGADILLVATGVPHQDLWIRQWSSRLKPNLVMGVGGLFDYYSGRIPRAPLWVRKLGSEWVWRLLQEPVRMAGRYLLGNPLFIGYSALNALEVQAERRGISQFSVSKRVLDISIAALALLILSPLLLLAACAIKFTSAGPVFFVQNRVGKNGQLFPMIKFRSMYEDAEERRAALLAQSERDDMCFKIRDDPRVTFVGRWLRKASMDELPQLFNVLRGEMSLVGPRPALQSEVDGYQPRERARLSGLPGITGLWQIAGRADISFRQQVEMDVAYLRSRSMLMDLGILIFTVPAILSGRGAY